MTNPIPTNLDAFAVGRSNTDVFITFFSDRSPTPSDIQFPIQKRWINTTTGSEWLLQNFVTTSGFLEANWRQINVGASGLVAELTGNTGGPVPPTLLGNINVVGDGTSITVAGNPATNTLTISTLPTPGTALWTFVVGNSQAMVENNYYAATNAGQTTFTLPVMASQGSVLAALATTAAGWKIVENVGQKMYLGDINSTITTGSLTSTNIGDIVYLLCTVANTTWFATGNIGNILII